MGIELLFFNGYGQFVWPAFVFTFSICFYLYFKTKAELKKQENLYQIEFKENQIKNIKFSNNNKETKREVLSTN